MEEKANSLKKKTIIDKVVKILFLSITILCSLIIIMIASFILFKGLSPFFRTYEKNGELYKIDFFKFLTGNTWFKSPNVYGVGYVLIDTVYITSISLLIAIPISVLTALFISRIAPKWLAKLINSAIELLASVPSIIFGIFGSFVVTGIIKNLSTIFRFQSAGGLSGLSASLILAFMIMPTITTISIGAINAVRNDQILGSLALGSSKTQTNFKIVLRSAKFGIFSGIILGIGRALGEATAVSMVIGNSGSGPDFNLFDTGATLTSTMMLALHETTGMDYDIRFSIGVLLILIIIVTNILLNIVKRKVGRSNEKYHK